MNKVEMNLKDYDQMKEDLRTYKEIFDAITTVHMSNWDKEYFSHYTASYPLGNSEVSAYLSQKSLRILQDAIRNNARAFLQSNHLPGNFDGYDISITLCKVKQEAQSAEQEGEDG